MDELGVNLAGVEVVMRLLQRLRATEAQLKSLQAENDRLRSALETHD